MDRRAFLAGVGAVGVGAVGAGATYTALAGGEGTPYELRVVPADRDATDVRCTLSREQVAEYPALEAALREAADRPHGEAVTRALDPKTASDVRYVLEQCDPGTTGNGLYRYRGEWYLAGIIITDPDLVVSHAGHDHDHGQTSGNETTADATTTDDR